MFDQTLTFEATVQHELIKADGTKITYAPDTRKMTKSPKALRSLWQRIRDYIPMFAGISFASFVEWMYHDKVLANHLMQLPQMAILTVPAANYMATTFVSNTNPLINFTYHSYGTGSVHGSTNAITSATNATPIVVTRNGHGYGNNDIVSISGGTGMTAINGIWQVSAVTTNTYTLLGSAGNGALGGSPVDQMLNCAADTALTTEASGLSRVVGTASNPTSNSFKSTVAVPFTGATPPLSIVEWALFSASTSGTMLDRRWMNTANAPSTTASASLTAAPITIVNSSDSINTSYTLTILSGGQ